MTKNLSHHASKKPEVFFGAESDPQSAHAVERARDQAATLLGPGFAKAADLAAYLRVSPRFVVTLAASKDLLPNQAGKFAWADVWWRMWRIRPVSAEMFEAMKKPLLKSADVAKLLGVHERSIRRDGDRPDPRYELPDHLDLSERIRRHHPIRIQMWSQGVSMPTWLKPVPAGQNLPLIGRKKANSDE